MAATPERRVKDECVKALKAFNVYYFFVPQNGYGRSGVPDIVGCCDGIFFAVECKAGKNTTTALQQREIGNIRNAGGVTFVINETNVNELWEWLEKNGSRHPRL